MHRDDVVVIGFFALLVFTFWGLGYLFIADMEYESRLNEQCIAAGKQVVDGNCINE